MATIEVDFDVAGIYIYLLDSKSKVIKQTNNGEHIVVLISGKSWFTNESFEACFTLGPKIPTIYDMIYEL
jgi:hypothetical protein